MSKKMTRYPSDRKVYVGDLGNNARKNDLEYAFGEYGTLRSVWIARNPPGFAFVEFESARDAADAVRGLDGRTVCGRRARVELSTGKIAGGGGGRGAGGGGGDRRGGGPGGVMRDRPRRNNMDENKCYECGGRGHYARECRRREGRRGSRRREVFTYQPEADNTLLVKKRKHSEISPAATKVEEEVVEAEEEANNGNDEAGTSASAEKKKKKKKKNKNKDQEQTAEEEQQPAKKKPKKKEPDSD